MLYVLCAKSPLMWSRSWEGCSQARLEYHQTCVQSYHLLFNRPSLGSQASYALGYNLAIEYLADYEKTWMLDSFRDLDTRIFSGLGKKVDWIFLEVHAEGE